jgi:hypothetical protein
VIEGGIRCKAGTAMGACSLAHGDVISVGVVPLLLFNVQLPHPVPLHTARSTGPRGSGDQLFPLDWTNSWLEVL